MRHRTDGNHSEIIKALRRIGAVVISMTGDPEIGFDALVAYRGRLHVMEIKDGDKSPSERKLTDNEQIRQAMLEAVCVPYNIVESVADALEMVNNGK